MRLNTLAPLLATSLALIDGASALRSKAGEKIQLSKVQSLTLRAGLQTSHRRVSAIPQLQCIGGSAKGLYEVDVMRCKNSGSSFGSEDIEWTCTASLPEEFKLGSTDVICEGYDSPDDPYVLKGSCGVEYRLVLTGKGKEKYGKGRGGGGWGDHEGGDERYPETSGSKFAAALFWLVFIAVAGWIIFNIVKGWMNPDNTPGVAGGNRPGWGGGGGGWGGNDDPPPPYDPSPPRNNPKSSYGYGSTQPSSRGGGGWNNSALWGTLGGAAAGYAAGRMGNRTNERPAYNGGNNRGSSFGGGSGWNNGEGSSRSSSGSSSGPSYSSTRHESTGFGSTSRR